jgi:cyclophilin family peptidyl-prolyl cis-trans isomerase/HEAT repeat protein
MKSTLILIFLFTISISFSQNRFSNNNVLRKIYGFEYERQTDSLLAFLESDSQKVRYAAIQGIASVQDTTLAPKLLQMLDLEKVDSTKLALIYSLSQLDCNSAFYGLIKYESNCAPSAIKWACLAAIGKIYKQDATDFFLGKFKAYHKLGNVFINQWLKGLYLAKRRNQIDIYKGNENLATCLNAILEDNLEHTDEINYYYSKIMNEPLAASGDVLLIPIKSLKDIDSQLQLIKSPYQQLEEVKKYQLSAIVCNELLQSNYHSLLKWYALDLYLKKHTWNNKIDQSYIQTIFDMMDVALISRMCEYVVEQKENSKPIEVNVDVFKNMQRQLLLPRDFETWIDLEKAILSFEGKKYHYKSCFETGYKNAIDWDYIVKINANQKVKIITNKGTMILLLKVNEAPGSVANFLKLVDLGYYNGKYFHRMVYNFVVQGGCPRGDGWGSLEWNQRSELSSNLRYKKGSVGLASVGKDSEGVQFFISHNYAPHLDGRYTIFAEVIKGFDVINNLVVGDQMISVERVP